MIIRVIQLLWGELDSSVDTWVNRKSDEQEDKDLVGLQYWVTEPLSEATCGRLHAAVGRKHAKHRCPFMEVEGVHGEWIRVWEGERLAKVGVNGQWFVAGEDVR